MKAWKNLVHISVRPKREKLVSAEYRICGHFQRIFGRIGIYPIVKPNLPSIFKTFYTWFASAWQKCSQMESCNSSYIWFDRKIREIEYCNFICNFICPWFDGKLVKLNTATWFAYDLTEKMKKKLPSITEKKNFVKWTIWIKTLLSRNFCQNRVARKRDLLYLKILAKPSIGRFHAKKKKRFPHF